MGYKPIDVWLQPALKPDGSKYCNYILCYVDKVLCILTDPKKSKQRIKEDFKLKEDKILELDVFLGATMAKMSLKNVKMCWTSMLPEQYAKTVVTNVEEDSVKYGKRQPSKHVTTPFSCNYVPWLKETPELKANGKTTLPGTHWPTPVGK